MPVSGVKAELIKRVEAAMAIIDDVESVAPPTSEVDSGTADRGSTLKEVLKHKTVEVVKMIGADEDYSREWNRCSDMIDGTEWCGDDSRVEIINKDASDWFSAQCRMNQLNPTIHKEERFHVVIIDIL